MGIQYVPFFSASELMRLSGWWRGPGTSCDFKEGATTPVEKRQGKPASVHGETNQRHFWCLWPPGAFEGISQLLVKKEASHLSLL